ncbi:MAG TPA: ornithine carbamoyltransferase [Porticoccaceae bacterium]|jgi:ornithine carbamoyltransferase|nr:ornithine carbamoyltransferase [Gammaproteobacteria bacterium]HIL60426.1 ornithine carbamoyltransferase [Porticoccaceae bacterium]
MSSRHFLNLLDLSKDELQTIIARAIELKSLGLPSQTLSQKTLGLIFDKSSTRTRVAFEVAMTQLGGNSLFLSNQDSQLGRGEPVADSARVLSRMVDCLAIRTFDQAMLEEFALHSNVPVINALSDDFHPCQLLADMQTYVEHKGGISGKTVSWIGDGNNMCQSYINAAIQFDFELKIASPFGYEPRKDLLELSPNRVSLLRSPSEAVAGSDLVVTDVWSSMGQEEEQARRKLAFADYQVTEELMSKAHSDALFMHCLPAHRGEEVSTKLLDREDCVVWDEAENRMHSQKALLEFMLNS